LTAEIIELLVLIKFVTSFLSKRKFIAPVEGETSKHRDEQARMSQVSVQSPDAIQTYYVTPQTTGVNPAFFAYDT
jgi:hypothetical protein